MYWEHLWIRLAIATEKTTDIRILETSKRLQWSANRQQYVFDALPAGTRVVPNPMQSGGMMQSSGPQYKEALPVEVWVRCLDSLGSDGYELVSVASLTGDVRVEQMHVEDRERMKLGGAAALGTFGRYDVQLWVFKRERTDDTAPEEEFDQETE